MSFFRLSVQKKFKWHFDSKSQLLSLSLKLAVKKSMFLLYIHFLLNDGLLIKMLNKDRKKEQNIPNSIFLYIYSHFFIIFCAYVDAYIQMWHAIFFKIINN